MEHDPIRNLVTAVDKTFVYENVEIRKTGRQAERKLSSGKVDALVEITPADHMNGSWKKWVRENDLYEVK